MKKLLKDFALPAFLLLGCTNIATAQEYNQPIAMEGVEMYGLITYSPINQFDVMTPGLYKFGFSEQFKPDDNGILFPSYISGGGVYHNGKIYCNIYSDEARVAEQKPIWTILDSETYEVLYERELADNCECTTTSLAYDITNDKIYGIVADYTDSHLVEIDPETGDMRRVGNNFARELRFKTLVSTNTGMLYSVVIDTKDSGQYLYKIRKSDGMAVKVKAITGKNLLGPEDYLVNNGSEQSMFINRATEKVYWIFESSSLTLDGNYTPIVELNLTNAEGTIVSYLSRTYQVSGAWLKEPNSGAPAIASDFKYVPSEEGELSGNFQIQLPENDYLGNQLTDATLNIRVVEGDNVLIDAQAAPGSLFTSETTTLSEGNHTVSITLSNDAGNSPTIQRTFYAGYDTPAAPSNIKLTYDGLTTTLTWDAPTVGINGAVIDKENIYYKVYRQTEYYEGSIEVVADNLKECSFSETLSPDMTYYKYFIVSMYNGKDGGMGYSEDLILGSPLNPPFGGMFSDPNDMFNNYTLFDSNGDGYCWNYDMNIHSAIYIYNQNEAADDWMISPPINYNKVTTYTLHFKAYSSLADYPESMEVTLGKGRTPEEQTIQLINIPEVPGASEESPVTEYALPFTVDEDGIYYYAFHVTSAAFREFLRVFDIRIEMTSGVEQVTSESGIVVSTGKNFVRVQNPEGDNVAIYNTSGMLIDSFTQTDYERTLNSGIYIVKSSHSVEKIIVK